jgi:hypothetical protein
LLSCRLYGRKKFSQQDAGSLNTFDRNEIEVAPISSALLRIACLVILYKTPCSGPRTRSRWDVRTGRLLKQNENRRDGAATGLCSYLVVRSCGSGRARPPSAPGGHVGGTPWSHHRSAQTIHAKIGDSLIDLSTLNPRKGLIEKSFDLEPRLLQSAIETGSFEITEIFDQSMIKKSSLVVRFSTLELSANIVALELKCA